MTPVSAPPAYKYPPAATPDSSPETTEAAAAGWTGDRFRLLALAAITVALIALSVVLAFPFLSAITWGVALAIIAWPAHRWICRLVAQPTVAAVISTLLVVVLIVAPGLFVAYQLAREATTAVDQAQVESAGSVREKLAGVPVVNQVMAWADRVGVDVEAEARKVVASYTQDAAGVLQGSVTSVVQFLVAVFILYHLFRDRGVFLRGLRGLLPLSREESDKVFTRAADSVHANLYATVVTSLIDAVGGGLMFWALGLPAPFLWGVVIFVLSLLPVVGAALVWFPAVVFLALSGRWLAAAALLGWGVLSFIIVDNVLYVRLAGPRMRMHEVPALIAFLGGLAIFGLSGMILGPAILAVTVALVEVWKRRLARADDAAPAPAPGEVPVPHG